MSGLGGELEQPGRSVDSLGKGLSSARGKHLAVPISRGQYGVVSYPYRRLRRRRRSQLLSRLA